MQLGRSIPSQFVWVGVVGFANPPPPSRGPIWAPVATAPGLLWSFGVFNRQMHLCESVRRLYYAILAQTDPHPAEYARLSTLGGDFWRIGRRHLL